MSNRFQVVVKNKDNTTMTISRDRFFATRKKAEIYKKAMEDAGFSASIWDTRGNALSKMFRF